MLTLANPEVLVSGFSAPLWALPIILVAAAGAAWYRKSRDRDR
jgi:hypothetical protein